MGWLPFFVATLYTEKVLIIILIKNEIGVWYKITLEKERSEKWIELRLERIGKRNRVVVQGEGKVK